MHIGIDFDNTIVHYDDVFYKYAIEEKLIARGVEASKEEVKKHIRALPRGNEKWTALQAVVYGRKMKEAIFKKGAEKFIKKCREKKIQISIISHKTKFDASGSGINLRAAAIKWMEMNGFFEKDSLGFSEADIFFESTRKEKIDRIIARKCSHFIDDLIDVFNEEDFPDNIVKMHYNSRESETRSDVIAFSGWNEIYEYFFQN